MAKKTAAGAPQINIGIGERDCGAIAGGPSHLLADPYTLYLTAHSFHWNVTGPMFNTLHTIFMAQYTALWNAVDPIAERVRSLGHPAPGRYADYGALASIKDAPTTPPRALAMVKIPVACHAAVARTARSIFPPADKAGDEPTAEPVTQRLTVHEQTAWMLRSLLEAEQGRPAVPADGPAPCAAPKLCQGPASQARQRRLPRSARQPAEVDLAVGGKSRAAEGRAAELAVQRVGDALDATAALRLAQQVQDLARQRKGRDRHRDLEHGLAVARHLAGQRRHPTGEALAAQVQLERHALVAHGPGTRVLHPQPGQEAHLQAFAGQALQADQVHPRRVAEGQAAAGAERQGRQGQRQPAAAAGTESGGTVGHDGLQGASAAGGQR